MPEPTKLFETRGISSLEKVFADQDLDAVAYNRASALQGEAYAFQVAYWAASTIVPISVSVDSTLADRITLRSVGLAPSDLPCQSGHDENILRETPGLYPDPLLPIKPTAGVAGLPKQWRSVWVTIELDENTAIGKHLITVRFSTETEGLLGGESFELEVIGAPLPEQTLIHTEWFHCDCLAQYYGIEVFSEAHWQIIEQYVKTAVKHGINMLLTPLFTPPLDTAVGGERLTVQLVEVKKDGNGYSFGLSRLKRWIDMCHTAGIRYFEFSHFFTQWGAKHAPKIIAEVDGEQKRIFGWDTDAAGEAYKDFLHQFLPVLVAFLYEQKLEKHSYFHISDEPLLEHRPWYRSASEVLTAHLKGMPVMDAITNLEYYEEGLVKRPVPANNHIEPFLERGVPELWTYYCCVQYKEVSNRFFNMPSARNRMMGIQLYKFQMAGFLHWGYNFWNTRYSLKAIDPYRITDAGFHFPSGDAFLVYPGEDGRPVESIRMEVFQEGLQDLRALQLLESLIGRDQVLEMIEEGLPEPLTFRSYPKEAAWLLNFRESVNAAIKAHINN
ncbi:DUF4091 domain-containing protein [Paenibacillus aurantius]|uniref:DUF4091 domain-containing protein n=1 Tax=Paenibacillus aurantius TaxID=2918900 RepID=A0AA96LDJ8_9BACL|nr:DUF4091 domain-containing protein [Paenibacillus aurantius]WNQ11370.1 DUF4091 domain-containing protein [Paenibacillus aurantius]